MNYWNISFCTAFIVATTCGEKQTLVCTAEPTDRAEWTPRSDSCNVNYFAVTESLLLRVTHSRLQLDVYISGYAQSLQLKPFSQSFSFLNLANWVSVLLSHWENKHKALWHQLSNFTKLLLRVHLHSKSRNRWVLLCLFKIIIKKRNKPPCSCLSANLSVNLNCQKSPFSFILLFAGSLLM